MDSDNLKERIWRLKREKNAVILGHYYQREEIQEVSDYIGDSLALAREAQKSDKDIIVFCGVHFMAETAKILNPEKKVLIPDMEAGCSLADSCDAVSFRKFKEAHPGYLVISYINCTAEIKALSDIICTSGNAEKLVQSLPKDQKVIFAPDKNLGSYINGVTGRNMLLWDGVCMVHDAMQVEEVLKLKCQYKDAPVVAHPECNSALLAVADFIGSTKAMLGYVKQLSSKRIIVATEGGIVWEMKRQNPDKEFIVVKPTDAKNCNCSECSYMKLNTLQKLCDCLERESPEIKMRDDVIARAKKPIEKMLEMSKSLGIIK